MSELTGKEAKTIHRLLEVEWSDEDAQVFARDELHPLDADAIIVDELSMVDITLFDALLKAVPFGCRLVLVGDCDQLRPSARGTCCSIWWIRASCPSCGSRRSSVRRSRVSSS